MKRVCLISTVNHNVGDDFVRAGILWLLRRLDPDIQPAVVHKHFPVSVRGGLPARLEARFRSLMPRQSLWLRLSALLDALPLQPHADLLLGSDLVVQSGAPVYWKNQYSSCAQTEWFGPLIRKRWSLIRDRAPLLNLGAGSCQPLGDDGSSILQDAGCRDFIRELTTAAAVTTVRDSLAHSLLRQCGHEVPLLPCPAVFAPAAAGLSPGPGEYIALNYMPAAGHFDLSGQGADLRRRWEGRFTAQARHLSRRHPCLMICHDRRELREAARLLPDIPRFFSPRWQDCLGAYARGRGAFVNRVHGAAVAAAMGLPVVLVGNDSRLLLVREIPGVQAFPVDGPPGMLEEGIGRLAEDAAAPPQDMGAFLDGATAAYQTLLEPVLRPS